MNILLFCITIAALPALVTAITWLLLRRLTDSTKYAWAMAIAIGYAVGHIGLLAWFKLPADLASALVLTSWLKQLPVSAQAILWPTQAANWLPIGVLLAGLVSVNAALFQFQRTITFVGAGLISIWLALQLIGGVQTMQGNWITVNLGLKLALGMLAIAACWISIGKSIQGRPRWIWIISVTTLAVAAVVTLALTNNTSLAFYGAIVLSCMTGGFLTSLLRTSGTDNIRFSGAVIALASISLLLIGYWYSVMPWYPLALIVVGFIAVNGWMPPIARSHKMRVSIAVTTSLLAITVSALVRQGIL